MKSKILKICALCAVPFVVATASACGGTQIGENKSYYLQDDGLYPAVAAPYEEESRAAISRWESASASERDDVAKEVAAELYAYACYNEEYIDKYVYFSSQTGSTSLAGGSGSVTNQNYKLIINADEASGQVGYKYHYTIKHVENATGSINTFRNQYENARLRFVAETNKLYRFEGDNIRYETDESGAATDMLTCDWTTGDDWGTEDPPIVKREGEKLSLEGIEQDIISISEDLDTYEAVIHGNINILADNIVKNATITEGRANGHTVFEVVMEINSVVANADEASQSMLKHANMDASRCDWDADENGVGPIITFQIWDNGLMKYYKIDESWNGTVMILFSGSADTETEVWYSYSDRDTDMEDKLAMLEDAKTARG